MTGLTHPKFNDGIIVFFFSIFVHVVFQILLILFELLFKCNHTAILPTFLFEKKNYSLVQMVVLKSVLV